ncbi:MAG: hypothetical protein EHM87_14375 [Burkholderiales bacterium]|nr:MAG: hypothetical protein EHM87_14375 [Burkholderiales bacterium]
MAAPKPDLHLRIPEEADAVLELLATAGDKTKTRVAEELLTEALLGKGHALKVAALRYARLGFGGSGRE